MSNGLTEEVVTGKQWYVLNAWPQHDKQVYDKLVRRKITAFLPVTNMPCKGGGEKVIRPVSLMPGYVFARCDQDELQSLKDRRIPNAHLLQGIVEDECIKTLREQIDGVRTNGHVIRPERPASFTHKRVRIIDGPFAAFEGLATEEDLVHGMITVEIQILGRPVPTEVPVHQLEEVR